jgi:hypothetical protein
MLCYRLSLAQNALNPSTRSRVLANELHNIAGLSPAVVNGASLKPVFDRNRMVTRTRLLPDEIMVLSVIRGISIRY